MFAGHPGDVLESKGGEFKARQRAALLAVGNQGGRHPFLRCQTKAGAARPAGRRLVLPSCSQPGQRKADVAPRGHHRTVWVGRDLIKHLQGCHPPEQVAQGVFKRRCF